MSEIYVCPFSALGKTLRKSGAKTMIAFGGPEAKFDHPAQIEQHVALRFNDIAEPRPGLEEPTEDHIRKILSVADGWDRQAPILLQCWMGISRSTATAAIVAMKLRHDLDPRVVAGALREASPVATPNPLMIALADKLLGQSGCFSAAIRSIGRGAEAAEGVPFSLDPFSL